MFEMKIKFLIVFFTIFFKVYSQNVDSSNNLISYSLNIKKMDAKKFHSFLKSAYNKYHNSLNFDCYDFVFNNDGYIGGYSDIKSKFLNGKYKDAIYFKVKVDSTALKNKRTSKTYQYHMACRLYQVFINDSITSIQLEVLESKILKKNSLIPTPPHFVKNPVYKKVNVLFEEAIKIIECIKLYSSYLSPN